MINGEEYTQFRDSMILPSTTGFFISEPRGFRSAGTGTFVRIGKVNGILTCAHALDEMARHKTINLAIFPVRERERFIQLDGKEHCDYIKFGPKKTPDGLYDPNGPDLAFLKLPIPFFNSISHLVSVKSMEIGRDHAFAEAEPSEESITVVTGMIAEWMPEVEPTTPFPVSGLMSVGKIADRIKNGEHDLFHFRPVPDDGFNTPSSYKGTSGGGLWRIYPQPDDGGEIVYRLIGVAFQETNDRHRHIICHGQASLYVRLFDAIREKWPEAR
jgi:hypothetical protein